MTPQLTGKGRWTNVSSDWISGFSAVCWFGGRDLFDQLNGEVPVGLISSDVGVSKEIKMSIIISAMTIIRIGRHFVPLTLFLLRHLSQAII